MGVVSLGNEYYPLVKGDGGPGSRPGDSNIRGRREEEEPARQKESGGAGRPPAESAGFGEGSSAWVSLAVAAGKPPMAVTGVPWLGRGRRRLGVG